jgi:hypothetical protein
VREQIIEELLTLLEVCDKSYRQSAGCWIPRSLWDSILAKAAQLEPPPDDPPTRSEMDCLHSGGPLNRSNKFGGRVLEVHEL